MNAAAAADRNTVAVPMGLRIIAAFIGIIEPPLLEFAFDASREALAEPVDPAFPHDQIYRAMNRLREQRYPDDDLIEHEVRSRFDRDNTTVDNCHGSDVIQQFTFAHDQAAFALGFAVAYRLLREHDALTTGNARGEA